MVVFSLDFGIYGKSLSQGPLSGSSKGSRTVALGFLQGYGTTWVIL